MAEASNQQIGLDIPDLIPVRMLNEYAYCPRLAYLEWVQGEFVDSPDTIEGRLRHRRVDQAGGKMPHPGESDELVDGSRSYYARALLLSAPKEGLIARFDVLAGDGKRVMPIDYKRGRVPDVPERAWEPERVQVCAQGLILRENGYEAVSGSIYYVESKTHVAVPFTEVLINRTRELVQSMRQMAAFAELPPPLTDSPKCIRCSLASICLPDETNLLRNELRETRQLRRISPARDDRIPVYVQAQGVSIGKKDDRLVVREAGKILDETRIMEISHVNLLGNIQMSAQLLRELAAQDIPVCHYTTGGWFMAMTSGHTHKNIELRLRQYEWATTAEKSIELARGFINGKLKNCRVLLRRNHPGDATPALKELQRLNIQVQRTSSAESLLGLEGTAARTYFYYFAQLLRQDRGTFEFKNRNRRPPRDPVNALLSFAYSLLIKDVMLALMAAGFDPYLGFFHRPRYGRPALALDMAEEFRPLVADSVVLATVNRGELDTEDFLQRAGGVTLTPGGRKRFLAAYERRMDTLITHPLFGYSISYRRVLSVQARLLARVLTGEVARYRAFVTR